LLESAVGVVFSGLSAIFEKDCFSFPDAINGMVRAILTSISFIFTVESGVPSQRQIAPLGVQFPYNNKKFDNMNGIRRNET
jgi:hypothetical protein